MISIALLLNNSIIKLPFHNFLYIDFKCRGFFCVLHVLLNNIQTFEQISFQVSKHLKNPNISYIHVLGYDYVNV